MKTYVLGTRGLPPFCILELAALAQAGMLRLSASSATLPGLRTTAVADVCFCSECLAFRTQL